MKLWYNKAFSEIALLGASWKFPFMAAVEISILNATTLSTHLLLYEVFPVDWHKEWMPLDFFHILFPSSQPNQKKPLRG